MTVGRDTYVTQKEAIGLLRELLPSADSARIAFEKLSVKDQEVYLRRAMTAIESLIYSGKKTTPGQPLQFPRSGWSEIPRMVKMAQTLEACAIAAGGAEAAKRAMLQAQGVKCFSAGALSESYETAGKTTLLSMDAQRLLKPYIKGAARFV